MLAPMVKWLHSVVLPWVRSILTDDENEKDIGSKAFEQWCGRLNFKLLSTFCDLRITEMFNAIRDYEESIPMMRDMKKCLKRTHQHKELAEALRISLQTR